MLGCCAAPAGGGSGGGANTPKPQEQARRKSIQAGVTGGPVMKVDGKSSSQIGYYSNHGWAIKKNVFGVAKTKEATPKVNQDRLFITPKFCDASDAFLFGCYDGNGPKGEKVADMAGLEICGLLEQRKDSVLGSDPRAAFITAFREANAKIVKERFADKSGTTATVVFLRGSKVVVANVGDSKAVRATADADGKWTPEVLTTAHKPDEGAEQARIEACGGYILKEDEFGAARVFDNPDPIGQMVQLSSMAGSMSGGGMGGMGGLGGAGASEGAMAFMAEPWPGLAMSRVLGHSGVANLGIIPDPDVKSFELTSGDRCLVLASDGVWDFIDDQEVIDTAKKFRPDANAACKALVETASARWVEDDPTYRDDISCCVIYTPLDGSAEGAVSHERIGLTTDDAAAKAEALAEEAEEAKKQPDGSFLGGIFGGPASAPAAATPDVSDPGGKKGGKAKAGDGKVKANKEQRRRSVVTRFG